MSWEDILKKVNIKIDPMDEESDYDGHEHKWKYMKTYGSSDFKGGVEYGLKLYRCTICGREVEVRVDEA